ncbi:MAG: tetratricopeptide repeat protein [Candidatus Omnitrophica bacterium]|nr:tetratricopeptide repeat protein [Candidatus Omnitrophota bacterium]
MFKHRAKEMTGMRVIYLLLGLSSMASPLAWAASPATSVRDGNRLYSQGNFEDAGRRYEEALKNNPESAIVNFNAGTAFYKQKHYPEAIQHLQKALLGDDPRLKEKAYYNLGNTLYQSGIGHETKDTGAAVQALQESLGHFESALRLDKTDKDAQYNYEFVKKELERLKQEQKQQSSKGQKEKQNQDSGSKEDQKNQASEQGQEQQKKTSEDKEPAAPETSEEKKESGQPAEEHEGQAASATVGNSRDLTKEEAERILQSYQQAEEPRGLLKVFQNKGESRPVLKDW